MNFRTYLIFSISCLMTLASCNLVQWNQKRINKKLSRNEITESTFTSSQNTIHYYKGGTGPTLLLIHGFGGDAQITWYESMLHLQENYTVIAPDLLWFGKSSSSQTPNLDAQVNAIYQLLNHFSIDTFSIAGISYGGFVSLGMYYKEPTRIKKLIIIDSPGVTYEINELDSLCERNEVKDVSEIFVVKDDIGVQRLMNLAMYKEQRIPKVLLKQMYEVYFDQHHKELAELLRTLPSEKEKLSKLAPESYPPSLIIWGKYDQVFPLAQGQLLANHMQAELAIIDKAGHAPNIEQFSTFIEILENFLKMN